MQTILNDTDLMWQCFLHFAHLDHSNAAVHCADVRYSPITFRLAETLDRKKATWKAGLGVPFTLLKDVLDHRGAYPEDRGRVELEESPGRPDPVKSDEREVRA